MMVAAGVWWWRAQVAGGHFRICANGMIPDPAGRPQEDGPVTALGRVACPITAARAP